MPAAEVAEASFFLPSLKSEDRAGGRPQEKENPVRRLRQTSFRWRFPSRTLHVVDILARVAGTVIYLDGPQAAAAAA